MANPHRGEVMLDAAGVPYRFCFTIDALCQLEDRLEMTIVDVSQLLATGNIRLKVLRAILWAGLQTHHAPISEVEAGELIGQIGATSLMAGIAVAMNRAFGAEDDDAEAAGPAGDAPADPPKARRRGKAGLAGTG